MEANANKDFKAFLKGYLKTKASYKVDGDNSRYWTEVEKHKLTIREMVYRPGFCQSLSKENLLKLVAIQGSQRFMPEHSFYIYVTKGIEL